MENEGNKSKFFQLLKELAELQATNMKLQAAIFVREARENVSEAVEELTNSMKSTAKEYGKKAEELVEEYESGKQGKENVISKFKECLEEINKEYEEDMIYYTERKQELEEDELRVNKFEYELKERKKKIAKSPEYKDRKEHEKDLIKSINRATKQGDLEDATEMIDELKELRNTDPLAQIDSEIDRLENSREIIKAKLNECDEQIKECKRDRAKAIKEAKSDKRLSLQNMDKTSVIRKLLGGILNRVNGVNRFKNIVVKAIEKKVEGIAQDVLPVIKEEARKRREAATKKSEETRTKIEETLQVGLETLGGIKESVDQKVTNAVDKGKTTFNSLIQSGKDRKEQMISAMQERVEGKKEELAKLQERYEEKDEDNVEYKGAHFRKDDEEEQL